MSVLSGLSGGPGQVFLVNIQPAQPLSLDVNQTAVALYKIGGVVKEDARLLQKQDVDSDALPYLTEDVLTKMGVPTFGRRVKILKAAQLILSGAAGGAPSPQPPMTASQAMTVSPSSNSRSFSASMSVSSASAMPARRPEEDYSRAEPSSSPMSSSGVIRGAPPGDDAGEPDTEEDDEIDREYENPALQRAAEREAKAAAKAAGGGGEDDLFGTEEAATGDSFMAVKPWIGAMKEPSKPPKFNDSAPDRKLTIDWVHGYRGFDSRSNLVYNADGDIVYPVAGLVVVYNPRSKKQRYFQGHNDDIRCLAQHPSNKNVIATGQNATIVNGRSAPPFIQVWDSSSPDGGKVFTCPGTRTDRAIRAVCFLSDGKYLASVSNDDNHTVKIWDWKNGKMICDAKGDANPIYAIRANPKDAQEFVTVGKKHIMFWKFDGSRAKGKRASAGKDTLTFYSIAFSDLGYAVAGAADGNAYVFKGGVVSKTFPWHPKGKVLSIEPFQGGFISGGSDKTVRVWDNKMTQSVVHTFSEWCVSVWPSASGGELLVGTRGGDVFELPGFTEMAPLQGDEGITDAVTRGHGDGELWALAMVKGGNNYVTAGEDNTLCVWDVHKRKMTKRAIISDKKGKAPIVKKASTTSTHPTNQCARGLAVSPDRRTIVVGTNDGAVAVFDSKTLTRKATIDLNQYGKRNVKGQTGNWIQTIQFSPSGRTCAVGTHGSVVCLLDAADDFKCKGTLTKSSSAITSLDWSEDGAFIQTNDLGYELLFYSVDEENLGAAKQVTSATAMRDVAWHTHTCKLGWPVQGIFAPSQDGQDINSCDVSPSRALIATGDDNGDVKLFRYPAQKGAKADAYTGHASHVVTTRFTTDEKYLISTGGHDLSIIQWALS